MKKRSSNNAARPVVQETPSEAPTVADTAEAASSDGVARADESDVAGSEATGSEAVTLEASGAIIEDDAKAAVDFSHPAVDANPRADVPEYSNSIQFNDPGLSQREAVMRQLRGKS